MRIPFGCPPALKARTYKYCFGVTAFLLNQMSIPKLVHQDLYNLSPSHSGVVWHSPPEEHPLLAGQQAHRLVVFASM